MLIKILICIIIADFITGFIHWLEDTYGLPTWPLIGNEVIKPNIEHHLRPNVIGWMSSLWNRNYQTVVPAIVACSVLGYFGFWWVALTLLLASLGNEIHTWNHRARNNWFIVLLQDMCLVQNTRQHAKHHKPPYNKNFCTLTNWVNPILELIHFWAALEWIVGKTTGVWPKRMTKERNYV